MYDMFGKGTKGSDLISKQCKLRIWWKDEGFSRKLLLEKQSVTDANVYDGCHFSDLIALGDSQIG